MLQDYGMAKLWGTTRDSEIAVLIGDGKGMGVALNDPGSYPFPEVFFILPKEGAKRLITGLQNLLKDDSTFSTSPLIKPGLRATITRLKRGQFILWIWQDGWGRNIVLRKEELDILLNRWLIPYWGS